MNVMPRVGFFTIILRGHRDDAIQEFACQLWVAVGLRLCNETVGWGSPALSIVMPAQAVSICHQHSEGNRLRKWVRACAGTDGLEKFRK